VSNKRLTTRFNLMAWLGKRLFSFLNSPRLPPHWRARGLFDEGRCNGERSRHLNALHGEARHHIAQRRDCDQAFVEDKQWRIENVSHLKGLQLQLRCYTPYSESWDHDHCAACWAKFAEFEGRDIQHEGYATCDDYPKDACYEWVCQACFEGLKDDMQWSAVSE
jgi:hypothetical protein